MAKVRIESEGAPYLELVSVKLSCEEIVETNVVSVIRLTFLEHRLQKR